MVDTTYNNIEFTEEEIEGLNNSIVNEGESTVSQETEQSSEDAEKSVDAVQSAEESTKEESSTEVNEPEVEDSFDGLEIDGQQFDRDTILQWQDDSNNKSDWSKSNTIKAQKLSQWGKLGEKIQKDDTFRDHIKDYFFDNPEDIKSLGLDGDMDIPTPDPEPTLEVPDISPALERRIDTLEQVQGERVHEARVDHLDGQLTALENQFPDYLEGEKGAEFLEYTQKNAVKFMDGDTPNLERAFREWSYAAMQADLDHYKKLDKNGSKNKGKIIGTAQVGAKEVKTTKKLGWNDVSMDNPEIAKYFQDE